MPRKQARSQAACPCAVGAPPAITPSTATNPKVFLSILNLRIDKFCVWIMSQFRAVGGNGCKTCPDHQNSQLPIPPRLKRGTRCLEVTGPGSPSDWFFVVLVRL